LEYYDLQASKKISMIESLEELSSDLEWMILSGQAEERSLIYSLVCEYYPQLYRLNQAILVDSSTAELSTLESLLQVILESHRYSGRQGLRAWIYAFALIAARNKQQRMAGKGKSARDYSAIITDDYRILAGPKCETDIRIWQHVDQMDILSRIILIAMSVCELSARQLADIFQQPEWKVKQRFDEIRQKLIKETHGDGYSSLGFQDEPQRVQISQSFEKRCPLVDLSDGEITRLSQRIESMLKERRRERQRNKGLKELLVVVFMSALVIVGLRTTNHLISDNQFTVAEHAIATTNGANLQTYIPPNQVFQISAGEDIFIVIQTAPIPYSLITPLSIHSDSTSIRERMLMGSILWNSIWEEGQVDFYDPSGYLSTPFSRRYQKWINQDTIGLVLSGPVDSQPDNLKVLFNFPADSLRGTAAILEEQVGIGFQWSAIAGRSTDIVDLTGEDALQSRMSAQTRFKPITTDWLAYREVLIVDQVNVKEVREARLWIDTITGKLLGEQVFSEENDQVLLREARASIIYYDIDLPDDIFLPWDALSRYPPTETYQLSYFPRKSTEQPTNNVPDESLLSKKESPRQLFDPSASKLIFQWTGSFTFEGMMSGATELYADGYYLGDVDIGHPLGILHCQRSTDGMLLVFQEIGGSGQITEPVRWFNLSKPDEVHNSLSVTVVRSFSIAPDSRHLAVFGVGTPLPKDFKSTRGIFILDTVTGERVHAIEANVDILFGWSPNGDYVGGLKFHGSRADILSPVSLLAFNVETGDIIEGNILSRDFSMAAGQVIEFEFTELNWRGELNPRPSGLEGCVHP
jgi:DNA-directed RNA polymerase specialized sigma24 family protein